MIKFSCEKCGQKISVSEAHAGRKGKCPKCKNILFVPRIVHTSHLKDQEDSHIDKGNHVTEPDVELRLKREPPSQKGKTKPIYSTGFDVTGNQEKYTKPDVTEETTIRKIPWILDIFLYPTSMSGLINIGIFCVLTFLLGIFSILARLMCLIQLALFLVVLTVVAYIFHYIMECIRDSALGGIRAPENIGSMPADRSEAFSQLWDIIGLFIIIWGPVVGYCMYQIFSHASDIEVEYHPREDVIFWLLLGYGIFFFPIGMLALAMFKSSSAFNPFVWIASIFSTFFQYCGLVFFFCILGWLTSRIAFYLRQSLITSFFLNAVFIYLTMVTAHLLGRFYYKNSEKLNWEV